MKKLPNSLIIDYIQFIENRGIQSVKHPYYLKWFRFYLDFCSKYRHLPSEKDSLHLFIKKLEDKKQSEQFRKQARHSVALFWDMPALKKLLPLMEIHKITQCYLQIFQ